MATSNATRAAVRAALSRVAPVLTPQQADLIMRREAEDSFVTCQSFGLVLAVKTGDFFAAVVDDHSKAETLAHLVPAVQDHIEKLRALADILETALTRTMMAVEVHDDGPTLIAQAAAEAAIARAAESAKGAERLL